MDGRSFSYEKKSFINSRNEDIIILNEIWNNKLNIEIKILDVSPMGKGPMKPGFLSRHRFFL